MQYINKYINNSFMYTFHISFQIKFISMEILVISDWVINKENRNSI